MTDVGDDTQPAMCYPKSQQYEEWSARAEQRGYNSLSRFMIDMIEAGSKEIDVSVALDEDSAELRRQRNDLRKQLTEARERIATLEDQLYGAERTEIISFIQKQEDGATFGQILQHIIDDAPTRVAQHLDEMEGQKITRTDDQYQILQEDNDGN